MSGSDSTPDPGGADGEDRSGSGAGFLQGIEFLTGRDPNFGSFLLVVGIVTCVFIAVFQFTLPRPVSDLLTAGVLFVTLLTAIIASLLETLGYFDGAVAEAEAREDRTTARRPWVPAGGTAAPLPPMINFDAELRRFWELYDGDLPSAFDPFLEDYRRLKTNTENRSTIASDLRTDLNPIAALFEDGSEGDELTESISDGIFRYIDDDVDHLSTDGLVFLTEEGEEVDVAALENRLGRMSVTVHNEGEASDVDVVVEFLDADGNAVASRTCPAGTLSPGASRTVEADVYVPATARRAETTLRVSEPTETARA